MFGIVVLSLFAVVLAGCVQDTVNPSATPTPVPTGTGLQSFNSWDEVTAYLAATASSNVYAYGRGIMDGAMPITAEAKATDSSAPAPQATSAPGYSSTNVQVAGVDENDQVKTDGKYIYTLSQGRINIVEAYPASDAKLLYTINDSIYYNSLFLDNGKLVAFGTDNNYDWNPIVRPLETKLGIAQEDTASSGVGAAVNSKMIAMPDYYPYYSSNSVAKVFDVSDPSAPKDEGNVTFQGSLTAARLINGTVYAVYSSTSRRLPMPIYAVNGNLRELAPADISFVPCLGCGGKQFTTLLGFNPSDLSQQESRKIVLSGYSQNVYVSQDAAYLVYTGYGFEYAQWQPYLDAIGALPESVSSDIASIEALNISSLRKDNIKLEVILDYLDGRTDYETIMENVYKIQQDYYYRVQSSQQTVVNKFSLGDSIEYAGTGKVPGRTLNQFSMDEHNGYLRLATTTDQIWRSKASPTPSTNAVFVLDRGLNTVGRLEGLAPSETIYSARFMGGRAYLVTFRQLDPLFAIDLSNPAEPRVLGQLKIPGYSNYLHPIDENHLIGLGKDAIPVKNGAGEETGTAFPTGLKISIFDVTDVSTPKETASLTLGDAGTDSHALYDHHAFLFDAQKQLLVLPVTLAEVNPAKYPEGSDGVHVYGDYTFQGAYVFDVTADSITVRGRVSHTDNTTLQKQGWNYWNADGTNVERSLWIGDSLYTVSQKYVKANDINTLDAQSSVTLPYGDYYYGRPVPVDVMVE
ncbi:hypothetical protein AUJ14_05025 [Candidatus Micrarchaeota archaeon CG1_02_55_22]|nr:MAG: hypothetical protein AUJ14_05025 [Candidatus Micrarchaeota archaeon CG1_02_55_22]